mgnify:CR=1 FL=1
MTSRSRLCASVGLGALGVLTACPALAQGDTVSEVVVTGSLIRGGVQTNALPVDVLTSQDLERRGSPSVVELLKSLPASTGVLGDSNQFDSRALATEGSGSVNLRGLGPQRTLVLLNGRRMPVNPAGQGGTGIVDTNMIPIAAIGRIEVLKDGAAATYGSDAIAGVVNFITRRDFTGLEVSADYAAIRGSNGAYGLSAAYGWSGDRANVLVSAGWQHRSELSVRDRSWAIKSYAENPEGGWNPISNPHSFLPLAANGLNPAGQPQRDVGCGLLGGFPGFASATVPACFAQATPFDNLVEKEEHLQVYGEVNYDISETTTLHIEGLWGYTRLPRWGTAPSYPLLGVPTAEAQAIPAQAGAYYVPANHPGLIAYYAANGLGPVPAGGVRLLLNRPYGLGGNPSFEDGGAKGVREFDLFRLSAELRGRAFDDKVNWNLAVTYGEDKAHNTAYDTLINRYQLALRGLGGPNCNRALNTPGQNGCLYYNPFSNAIAGNPNTGVTNPGYNPAVANSVEVTDWFFQEGAADLSATTFVADAVFDGDTGITLPGGTVGWAVGAQFRRNTHKTRFSEFRSNETSPCVNTPDFGVTDCTGNARVGPFAFTPTGRPQHISSEVVAGFAELQFPITERLQAQLAARFEDYSGRTGSTFDPKVALRFQAADWLALRASASTTFRAPGLTQRSADISTSLQSILGSQRTVDIQGDPALKPETATTWSFGVILTPGDLRATIDFWRFDFEDAIATEPVAGIVSAVFPNGANGPNNCADPAVAALVARFTFTGGVCSAANVSRLLVRNANGADQTLAGIDVGAEYRFRDVAGGDVALGGSLSYVAKYKVAATTIAGIEVAPAFDGAGALNAQTNLYPVPEVKASAHAEWSNARMSVRWTLNYIGEMEDRRTGLFEPNLYRDERNQLFTVTAGRTVKAFVTHDLTARVELPWETRAVLSVSNVFDKDPPFARLSLNYDPFTASALGRVVKLAVTKRY